MFEKLKGNLEYIKGKKPILIEYSNENTLPYLSAEYLRNNKLESYVDKKNIDSKYHCNNNDLLIIWDGSNSGEVFIGKPGVLSSTMAKLKIKDEKYINKYLYYFLKQKFSVLNEKVTGAAIPHLNKAVLENLEIYSATQSEQQEIVQVLDTMSDIIRLREECLSHAQALIPALFQEMFKSYANSTKITLNNLFEFKSGGTPSKQIKEYFSGDIPWITTVALNKLYIGKDDANEFITEEAIQKSATKLIPENSLLFGTRVGIGKLAINTVPMCTNQDIVALIPFKNKNLNLVYAYWYLKQINNFFVANGRGATIQGITTHLVKSTEIILPPIEIQEQFAQKVIEIESYIKEQDDELKNAKQMFQSLLHHAFTGELTKHKYGEINE